MPGALQDKALPADQFIVANEENLDISLVSVLGKGDDILLASYLGGDSLPFNDVTYRLNLVPE